MPHKVIKSIHKLKTEYPCDLKLWRMYFFTIPSIYAKQKSLKKKLNVI